MLWQFCCLLRRQDISSEFLQGVIYSRTYSFSEMSFEARLKFSREVIRLMEVSLLGWLGCYVSGPPPHPSRLGKRRPDIEDDECTDELLALHI